MHHRLIAPIVASVVALSALVPAAAAQTAPESESFIVVLREGEATDVVAREHARTYGFEVSHLYRTVLNGYAARISPSVGKRLSGDPHVEYVAPDLAMQAPPQPGDSYQQYPPGTTGPIFTLQSAPKGVRRIGASTNGVSQTLANNGDGVGVAVIDTGIQLNHPDLQPVQNGTNCVNPALQAEDDNSHGTHVAGTIAARDNSIGVVGVAPGASLIAVKVLDAGGNGSWSSVICGIEWVTNNAAAKGIKVANMSLGGFGTITPSNANCTNGNADAMHTAICNSVKAGITYVVAAGNSSANTSDFVPAGYSEVIAVSNWSDTNGTTDATGPTYSCPSGVQIDETWATSTNYGSVVDIAAPGVGIRSTVTGSGYGYKCGTSMAAPHVSGAAALLLKTSPGLSPASVRTTLRNLASPLADSVQHTENLLNAAGL